MNYIEIKPIVFSNFFEKKMFLRINTLDNIIYQEKRMFAFKYNVESYKSIFNTKVKKSMDKHKGSFMIISNRQLAYVTYKLSQSKFNLEDVKILNLVTRRMETSSDFFEDDYDRYSLNDFKNYFDTIIHGNVGEIVLQNELKRIELKINGVITFSNFSSKEIDNYLSSIVEAYNESQR